MLYIDKEGGSCGKEVYGSVFVEKWQNASKQYDTEFIFKIK